MTEKSNLIREEILDGGIKGNKNSNEKIVAFKSNIEKFEGLNKKIQYFNSIAGRGYTEALQGRQDLKKVLNFVLEKKGLGGKNDSSSKAYFDLEGDHIVLVLNSIINGKKNTSIDSLKKIHEVLNTTDGLLGVQTKIQKHAQILESTKSTLDGISKDYKNNTSLLSKTLDVASITFTGESQIKGNYEKSYENTKDTLMKNFLTFCNEYRELTNNPNISFTQKHELDLEKQKYMELMQGNLKNPTFGDMATNVTFGDVGHIMKLAGIGVVGEVKGFANAAVVAPVLFVLGTTKFIYENITNENAREATKAALVRVYMYFHQTNNSEKFNAFLKIFKDKFSEVLTKKPEEQAMLIGELAGEIMGTFFGAKGFGKAKDAMKISWKKGSGSLEQMLKLSEVKDFKQLKAVLAKVDKINFTRDIETGASIGNKDLLKIVQRIEKGEHSLVKSLPKGTIRDAAEEIIKNNGIVNDFKSSKLHKIYLKGARKTESMVLKGAIYSRNEIISAVSKINEILPAGVKNNFVSKNLVIGIEAVISGGGSTLNFIEDKLTNLIRVCVNKPAHKFIIPALEDLQTVLMEAKATIVTKKLLHDISEILHLDKLNSVIVGKKLNFASEFKYIKAESVVKKNAQDAFEKASVGLETELKQAGKSEAVIRQKLAELQKNIEREFDLKNIIAMVENKKLGGKVYGYIDGNGNLIAKAEYKELGLFTKDGYARFEKDGAIGFINRDGKEILSLQKIQTKDGIEKSISKMEVFDDSGKIKVDYKMVDIKTGEIIETKSKYGLIKGGEIEVIPEQDIISSRMKGKIQIIRKDQEQGKKIYTVVVKNGELEQKMHIETNQKVELFVDEAKGKVTYLDGNNLHIHKFGQESEIIKFSTPPKKFQFSQMSVGIGQDGETYILNSKFQVKAKFFGSKKDFARGNEFYEQKRIMGTQRMYNVEAEGESLKIYLGPDEIKVLSKNMLENTEGIIDIHKIETSHSFRGLTSSKGGIYLDGKNSEIGRQFELKTSDGKPLLKDNFSFDDTLGDLSTSEKTKVLVVESGDKKYIIDLKTSKKYELPDNIDPEFVFTENGLAQVSFNNGESFAVINKKGHILTQSEGRVLIGGKHYKIAETRIFGNGNIEILSNQNVKILRNRDGKVLLRTGEKIDVDGEKIFCKGIASYEHGMVEIVDEKKMNRLIKIDKEGGKKILVKQGKKLNNIDSPVKDYFLDERHGTIHLTLENGDIAMLNKEGKLIFGPGNFNYRGVNKEGIHTFEGVDGKKGFFLSDGKLLGGAEYDGIKFDSSRNVFILKNNGVDKVIEVNGKNVFDSKYGFEYVDYFDGIAIIKKDGKIGAYNSNKNIMIIEPAEGNWDLRLGLITGEGSKTKTEFIHSVSSNGKRGAYTREGLKVLDASYEDVAYNAEEKVFSFLKSDGNISDIAAPTISKDVKMYTQTGTMKKTEGIAGLGLYDTISTTKTAKTRVENSLKDQTLHYVGENEKSLIWALENTSVNEVLTGFEVGGNKIHDAFQDIIKSMWSSKGNIALVGEVTNAFNTVFNDFKKIYEARTGKKMLRREVNFLENSFRQRVEGEFYEMLSTSFEKKSLLNSTEITINYFNSFSTVLNKKSYFEAAAQRKVKNNLSFELFKEAVNK